MRRLSRHTPDCLLAIDQGSSGSKALVLDGEGRIRGVGRLCTVRRICPRPGWVEHHPSELLDSVVKAGRSALRAAGIPASRLAAVALANQGETVIAFDRLTGQPLLPAISWQDRRSLRQVQRWCADGLERTVRAHTGLKLDPYFSASKWRWILDQVPAARRLLLRDRLCLATSDTWLLWQLTGGDHCWTDPSTASRTMLLDLRRLCWDVPLGQMLGIPVHALPQVTPSNATVVGEIRSSFFGRTVPVAGLCVDQQAALFGHGALEAGQAKLTYGTGAFLLVNIGGQATLRVPGLLTCLGWQLGSYCDYVLDAGIYSAGSTLDWLVANAGLLDRHHQLDRILKKPAKVEDGVWFVPSLAGLAAPYWRPAARGAWLGLSLATTRADLVRAVAEAILFRVRDLVEAVQGARLKLQRLRVDGGLTRGRQLMQWQADILGIPLEILDCPEATAVGAAMMAGLAVGLWRTPSAIPSPVRVVRTVQPNRARHTVFRDRYERWRRIVERIAS